MDARLTRIRDLIAQKEQIDSELEGLIAGAPIKEKKPRACSTCGQEGHTSRSCPQKSLPPDGPTNV
jgi:zinc knuckle protein